MIKPWKLLSSKTSFENRWWKIVQETVELPDGTVYEDYFVNHNPGGVVVFALTETGNVLVNRQYKHGARETIEELTIGRFDEGESDALAAAQRELLEETGHGGGEWEKLATWVSNPTSSTSRIHAFLARGVKKLAEQKNDPREIIELSEVSPKELLAMAIEGRLATHASLATVFLAAERLGWLKRTI